MAAPFSMNNSHRTELRSTLTFLPAARRCEHMPVLVLDDDDDFRTALSDLLQEDGHAVRAYRSRAALPPLAALPTLKSTTHAVDGRLE